MRGRHASQSWIVGYNIASRSVAVYQTVLSFSDTEDDAPFQAGFPAGDLKALVKDSIRELLWEEPSLLTSTPRRPFDGRTAHGK